MNTTKLTTGKMHSSLESSLEGRLEKLQKDLAGIYNQLGPRQKPDKSKNILVVDEDQGVQGNVKNFLRIHGFKVTTTGDGLEALNHFHNSSFHLILTATHVPGINGNLIARYVKNHIQDFPIIGMSQSVWMTEDYFDTVVEKPLDFPTLLQKVRFQISKNIDIMKMV